MIGTRTIEIVSPPEGGLLKFETMSGREAMGSLFEFHVDLLSANGEIAIPDMLGKPLSIEITRDAAPPRWFNGMISRFALEEWTGDAYRYRAELRPLMWLLTRTSNSRIYQNQKIPDVIMDLLKAAGIPAKRSLGRESYAQWEYLVQYNETDFNFISRLMEQEGLSYYFTHDKGVHTLVLIDALTAHDPVAGYDKIPFSTAGDRVESAVQSHEFISSWSVEMEITSGAYAAKEFDFENPRAPLLSTHPSPNPHDHAKGELFEYPGVYIDTGERDEYVKRRLEEKQVEYEQVHAEGNAVGVTPGFTFTLTDHPAPNRNRKCLVTGASYSLTSTAHGTGADDATPDFMCTFTAIDSQRPFRSPSTTPKPHVPGPQTAIVVGPKGEEIWTDKYGRVKIQFHWDRVGKRDEKSSCWVRVSQVWAGAKWGGMHIPRIGQEVIVDFLEGDPDRPIITGRVYNGANLPPYDMAASTAAASKSTIRSHSTKGGGPNNYNELCFEDKIGDEEVYLQAEKDLEILVKNDEHREVKHDRKKDVGNDETTTVGGNRKETVTKDETITIDGERKETVAKDETITINGGRTETVAKDENITINGGRTEKVANDESIKIGGKQSVTVSHDQGVEVDGSRSLTVKQDESITVTGKSTKNVSKDLTFDSGAKLKQTAADEITIQTGDASITLKSNGDITIKGANIIISGSGDVSVKAGGNVNVKGSKVGQN